MTTREGWIYALIGRREVHVHLSDHDAIKAGVERKPDEHGSMTRKREDRSSS
jgi:hypothetical protein